MHKNAFLLKIMYKKFSLPIVKLNNVKAKLFVFFYDYVSRFFLLFFFFYFYLVLHPFTHQNPYSHQKLLFLETVTPYQTYPKI